MSDPLCAGSGAVDLDELFLFVAGRQNHLTRTATDVNVLKNLSLRAHLPGRFRHFAGAAGGGASGGGMGEEGGTAATSPAGGSATKTENELRKARARARAAEALEPWSDDDLRQALQSMLAAHALTADALFRLWDVSEAA